MKFDIVGVGAIGMLLGGGLAAIGEEVTFWTRSPEQADLLSSDGIHLEDSEGNLLVIQADKFKVHPINEHSTAYNHTPDWLFITTKQWHLDNQLLEALRSLNGKTTQLISFQNGIGHVEALQDALDIKRIYVGITTEGAKRKDARSVVRSQPGMTKIGLPQSTQLSYDGENDPLAENLTKILNLAGFEALLSKDIDKDIYRKLLINAVINPLTAIWRIPNGELLTTPERRKMLYQLCEEAKAIYHASEIPYDDDPYNQVVSVCQSTSNNISSMLKDVIQNAPTEIDSINGRLIEMGKAVGIPAPGHEMITLLIRGLRP